jgi:putative peptide zinc metalloprotease protein
MATYLFLRPGSRCSPFHNGSTGDGEYLLCTPDERQFRISSAAYRILSELNRGTSLEDVYAGMKTGATLEEFRDFVLKHYQAFLVSEHQAPFTPAARPQMKMLLHHKLLPASVVGKIAAALSGAYDLFSAPVLIGLVIAAHIALYRMFSAAGRAPVHASVALLAALFSVVVHEFGHASAVARFGGKPGGIGAGLYILMPVLYADVSQVWRFRPRQRIIVDLGGIYFQQICFAVFAFFALALHSASLRAACISIDVMTVVSINPVFRFDGYWVLVDWLGVPNLHRHAAAYLKEITQSLLHLRWQQPSFRALESSRLKMATFIVYALLGNVMVAAAVLLNLRWMKGTALALFNQTPLLWAQLVNAGAHHDVVRVLDMFTYMAFVVASGCTLVIALWLRGVGLYRRLRIPAEAPSAAKSRTATPV